jgi:membrane protein CcdC involved in cytochrome C biogenesis
VARRSEEILVTILISQGVILLVLAMVAVVNGGWLPALLVSLLAAVMLVSARRLRQRGRERRR